VHRPARRLFAASLAATLAACAGLGWGEPIEVSVVGMEPMAGEGMESRFLLKLRVQNPNDRPVEFDGVSIQLDVRGHRLATGVSDQRGTVPRFGEAVVAVPVTVPMSAVLRQVLGLVSGDLRSPKVDYRLRGRLASSGFGGASFDSTGELSLPSSIGGSGPRRAPGSEG
jgi:LEA14-like dessication related protein